MAHFPVFMVSGICLYSPGRKPWDVVCYLQKPFYCLSADRYLAWSELYILGMGALLCGADAAGAIVPGQAAGQESHQAAELGLYDIYSDGGMDLLPIGQHRSCMRIYQAVVSLWRFRVQHSFFPVYEGALGLGGSSALLRVPAADTQGDLGEDQG